MNRALLLALMIFRGVLPGILTMMEEVIDLSSVLLARGHDMRKEGLRRECVTCK
jgi:hypothetical protein